MSNKTITMEFYRNANFLDILFKLDPGILYKQKRNISTKNIFISYILAD